MAKPPILFKAPAVTVQRATEGLDGLAPPAVAVMQANGRSFPLESSAAELLVGYLQVVRAFFSPFPGSEKLITRFCGQISSHLAVTLRQSGREVVQERDVSRLIEDLGCIPDWRQIYADMG
jgi:hypothetical protein